MRKLPRCHIQSRVKPMASENGQPSFGATNYLYVDLDAALQAQSWGLSESQICLKSSFGDRPKLNLLAIRARQFHTIRGVKRCCVTHEALIVNECENSIDFILNQPYERCVWGMNLRLAGWARYFEPGPLEEFEFVKEPLAHSLLLL